MADWITYYQLEPWGPERGDLNAAIITCMLANIHRDSKRKPEPYVPADFMPKFGQMDEPSKPQGMSPEEILRAFDQLIATQERRGIVSRQ